MTSAVVGHKLLTIKPDDLVRTPTGETGTVEQINVDGSRRVRLLHGQVLDLWPAQLFLVRAAVPKPWPNRLPPKYSVNGD